MKPRILSIKLGYNPNSSSVGMMVQIFLYQSFVISILFAVIRILIGFKKQKSSIEDIKIEIQE